ncbi:DUF7302 family protein [Amycolatopsis sp. NPDC003731]
MKIRMLKDYGHDFEKRGAWLEEGTEVEVSDALGARLLSDGRAEPILEKPTAEKRTRRTKKEGE